MSQPPPVLGGGFFDSDLAWPRQLATVIDGTLRRKARYNSVMDQCQNCGTTLSDVYCPKCGQRNVRLDRPVFELLKEVARETFDVDGRAARTVRALFGQPGLITQEFLAGRRRRYTPPFRLYLVISVLFFLVVGWVTERGILLEPSLQPYDSLEHQARFVSNDLPKLMVLLLPVFALLLKLAFYQRNYFDHLIHALHLHCAAYVLLAFLFPLERLADTSWPLLVAQVFLMGWLATHCALSFRRVYAAGWFATAVRAVGLLVIYAGLLLTALQLASYLVR